MSAREWWIALNLVNCTVTLTAAILCCRRWRSARATRRIPSVVESERLTTDLTILLWLAQVSVSAFFFLMGAALIAVALSTHSETQAYVPLGTGAFAGGWLGFLLFHIEIERRLTRIARVSRQERDRRFRDGPGDVCLTSVY